MLFHDEAHKSAGWFDGYGIDPTIVSGVGMLALVIVAWATDPDAIAALFAGLVLTSPVLLPFGLFVVFWKTWIHYIRFAFWFSQKMVLLHIELPPEFERSPLAMELILTGLHNTGGETTFIARIWKGQFRGITSLEIASNGGRIGYYVHIREVWRDTFEARVYGQYPEARITEAEDYAAKLAYTLETHDMWGSEYKKDQLDAVPIRTYINWGLDKDPDKPEKQTDPLVNILEYMSNIGPDENVWFQIVLKPRKSSTEWYGFPIKRDDYKDGGNEAIKKIFDGAIARAQERITDTVQKEAAAGRGVQLLSQPERDRVEAIERNFSKLTFECGIRVIYVTKKGKFQGARIGNVVNFFKSFAYPDYNSLGVTRGLADTNYPWQDWHDIRQNAYKRKLYFWYRQRAYFFVPIDQTPVVMTTEELASVWHFPSQAVPTPGLQRVAARRAEAPTNLPIGVPNLPH